MDLDPGTLLDLRLFEFAGTPITVATLVIFLLILLSTRVLSHFLRRAIGHAYRTRGITDEGTVGVTLRLAHFGVMALGLAVALETIGIDLAALFAAGAIFAIALGFAMQNIAQNFVSGLILLFERTIKPGDVLRVEGTLVKVERLWIRTTIVRTLDDEEIIVPNATIVQSSVTNYTLHDTLYRVRGPVGVTYGSDMAVVRTTLEEAADRMSIRSRAKRPVVLLTEFGDSSVNFEVSIWIDDPWTVRRAKSDLHEAIWWALKEAHITIAFPQLDVHFDDPLPEGCGGLGTPPLRTPERASS